MGITCPSEYVEHWAEERIVKLAHPGHCHLLFIVELGSALMALHGIGATKPITLHGQKVTFGVLR